MVVSSLIYVRTRYWTVELSFEVQSLQKKHKHRKEENNQLFLESSMLKHPERMMALAKKLGLDFDHNNTDVYYVDP